MHRPRVTEKHDDSLLLTSTRLKPSRPRAPQPGPWWPDVRLQGKREAMATPTLQDKTRGNVQLSECCLAECLLVNRIPSRIHPSPPFRQRSLLWAQIDRLSFGKSSISRRPFPPFRNRDLEANDTNLANRLYDGCGRRRCKYATTLVIYSYPSTAHLSVLQNRWARASNSTMSVSAASFSVLSPTGITATATGDEHGEASESLSTGATAAIIIGIVLVTVVCAYAAWAVTEDERRQRRKRVLAGSLPRWSLRSEMAPGSDQGSDTWRLRGGTPASLWAPVRGVEPWPGSGGRSILVDSGRGRGDEAARSLGREGCRRRAARETRRRP
ncbi:hypothetical protein CDD83_1654 [Cordyceps sp. RAO-2017]|nr:hypothetical protein CDD83_1654 [Cordyceps sp. RAO-2017]